MRLSATLSRYMSRQFLVGFGSIFGGLLGLIALIEVVELLRRASSRPEVSVVENFQLVALKIPHVAQEIVPFAILFGAMLAFWRLTRSHELVVARAAGVSVWQFLLPVVVLAVLIGGFRVALFNPVASAMLSRYEQLENEHLRGRSSLLALSSSGLWMREGDSEGQSVIHARRVSQKDMTLEDVVIFLYEGADRFTGRVDAATARLQDGHWNLKDAWISGPNRPVRQLGDYRIRTELTLEKIQDSFASPETMSFWALPGFIGVLETAGFSATRHRLHWHSLLALPLLLAAMVLIAATFSLRVSRRGGTALILAGGVLAGFLLYFLSDVVFALGASGNIPVVLAAWTPAGISSLLGISMLLHLEDG